MIIGICGGTGSGKTTVANRILESVSASQVVFIQQDSYYRNLKDLPLDFRQVANFDHPDALDNDLLVNHVENHASLPPSQCVPRGGGIASQPTQPGHCASLLVP